MPLIRIDNISGAPLLYDRKPASNYGVTGFRVRPFIDRNFGAETESIMSRLFLRFETAGLGSVRAVLFGGIARDGTGRSYHHRNRAFDLDGLVLSSGETWVADTFPDKPHHYLAIESVLRQQFGTVLTYGYNAAHKDHIHFDNGDAIGFRRHSKSRVMYLQNALTLLFDKSLSVDGVYGPNTIAVEREVRRELGIGGFSKTANWLAFLEAAADVAFDRAGDRTIEELFA